MNFLITVCCLAIGSGAGLLLGYDPDEIKLFFFSACMGAALMVR
jgi:hypothetical protein